MKKLLPVRFVAPGEIAPEVSVTCVPERVAVNEAILGPGYSPNIVVPPPVISTSLPHATVGRVPCVNIFLLFGLFVSRELSPAKKVAR